MFKFIMPTFLFNIEKWKWNNEYRIYVSNMGHFKDEHKELLSVKIDGGGYCKIKTNCGYRSAHRLVMLTWRPIPDAENLTVDHLDHNKRNNAVDNLEWVTVLENRLRAKKDQLVETLSKEEKAIPVKPKAVVKTGDDMKDRNREVNIEANYLRKITDGTNIYSNAKLAGAALIKEYKLQGVSAKKIAIKIVAAIAFEKEYFSKKWSYVEED